MKSPRIAVYSLLLVLLVLLASGCVAPRVSTDIRESGKLEPIASFSVLPVQVVDGAISAGDPLAASLVSQAESLLMERGYVGADRLGSPGSMTIRLTLRREKTMRRSVSADPGSNYSESRPVEEGVLVLEALDPVQGGELWSGRARQKLPDSNPIIGPSQKDAWPLMLTALVEHFPRR